MAETEIVLLRRFIRTGDAEAFSEIIGRYAGLVYGAALRILADVDRASDVAQETFLQLAKDAGTVTGSLPGWLHRVATHKAIDQVRRDATRKHREAEYVAARPQETTEWKEISPFVDEGLNLLDPQLRAILISHFLEGRSTREIARAQGFSQATISRRIEAGIEQLRAGLRRRGILVAAAALGVLLADNAAQAAPQALLTELGKIALISGSLVAPAAAEAVSGVGAFATSVLTTIKTHAVAVAAAVVALGIGSAIIYRQTARPMQPHVQAPGGPAVPSPADPTFDASTEPPFVVGQPRQDALDRQIVASTGRPGGAGRWSLRGSAPLGLPGPEAETDPRAYIPVRVDPPGSVVVTGSTAAQTGASDRPAATDGGAQGARATSDGGEPNSPAVRQATDSPCRTPATDPETPADPNLLGSVSMGPVVAVANLRLMPPVKGSPAGMMKLQRQEATAVRPAAMRETPPGASKGLAYFVFRADGRDLQGAVYRSTGPGGPVVLCLDTDADGLWSDEREYVGRRLWPRSSCATYEFGPVYLRQGCDEPGGDAFYAQCSEGEWLSFWPAFYRDGRVVLNGKTHRLALVDCDFDGRFNDWFVPSAEDSRDPAGDVLAVDLDGDGEFVDRRPEESEIMPLGRVIRIDGRYYAIELAENGNRIEFRQAEL